MKAVIQFYSHREIYPTNSIKDCINRWTTKLYSRRYAHCSIIVGEYLFEYSKTGYKMLKADSVTSKPLKEVEVTLKNFSELERWENPKPINPFLGGLRLWASMHSGRFTNCSRAVGRTIGITRARTPDQLAKELGI